MWKRINKDTGHPFKQGDVRGILCFSCNAAIGLMKDDPDLLRSAIAYLGKRES